MSNLRKIPAKLAKALGISARYFIDKENYAIYKFYASGSNKGYSKQGYNQSEIREAVKKLKIEL